MRGGGVAVWVDKAILRSRVKRVSAYVGVRVEGRERDQKRRNAGIRREKEEEERLRRGSAENKREGNTF